MTDDLRDEPIDCGAEHLPGCYNPWHDRTWCLCGKATWPGQVGTWHNLPVHRTTPGPYGRPGYEVIGWRVDFLHATTCTETGGPHLCGIAVTA
jgi:hypothetical protein